MQRRLCERLETIGARLRSEEGGSEELIQTVMEAIDVVERIVKYYIPEPEYLEERRRLIGEERRRQTEGEWQELIEQVRAEME